MRLNRRLFLRGLGGAVVAAPYLGSIEERTAKAQGTAAAASPRRLIAMFTHYGCLTDRWFPENSHGALSNDDFVGTSLEVLAPHASKILLPRGIRAMNQWTAGGTLGQGNDSHTQVVGTYFTGVPVTPHTDDPFDFNTETKFNAMPTAPSLDHICARQVNPGGAPLFMRVSGREDSPQSGISYSAGQEPFVGLGSPMEAFSTLTGLLGDGSMSEDTYRALRGASVLDIVRDDLETLERFDMSAADRNKLQAWKELLDSLGGTFASQYCDPTTAAALGLTDENLQLSNELTGGGDTLTAPIADGLDHADVFSNVAVLAALCNQSRVTFLKYPGSYVFRGLGLEQESHGISHRIGNAGMQANCISGVNDLIQTIDMYYAQKFAHLVATLDAFDEGDGTLLDNTAAVWFQEMSDGNQHNLNNLPLIQAGSCGGYFKTGQAVNLHDGTSDLHRGNSAAICDNPSQELIDSGTPEDIGNAPINKYFCNLMNALGVKAGSDGFAAEGGSQEVTHFGMYDDTRDFVGGGTNPPRINDPGEFTDLKANA